MSRRLKLSIAVPLALVVLATVGAVALWEYHELPQFCGTCHIMQPYLESWNGSELSAYRHAQEGVTCLQCHEPTLQQQVDELLVYVQGDFQVPLEERQYETEFCFGCHLPNEHTNYEQIILATAELELNPHDSHLGEMECSICHKVHKPSEDYCADCHEAVATEPGWTTEVTRTAEVQVWAPDMDCSVCHVMDTYFDSLQDTHLLAYTHAQEGLACLDCHEVEAVEQAHEGAVAGIPMKQRKFEMEFCLDCHLPNEHTSYAEIIERTEGLEEEIGANPHDSHFGEMECRVCHKIHRESEDYCAQCHSWEWEVP